MADPNSTPGEAPLEAKLFDAISGMLARADYAIPLAAAESQFRRHYYGLNSAALLEDLFFDALGNFLRQTAPNLELVRPATGQKGWDYSLDGLKVSHKVSNEVAAIGALWDATRTDVESWSFGEPIVYSLSQNNPATVLVTVDGAQLRCTAISRFNSPFELPKGTILITRWPTSGPPEILEAIPVAAGSIATDVLPFRRIWSYVSELAGRLDHANFLDVLFTRGSVSATENEPCTIESSHRAGVYVLAQELLQDLPVEFNNRGVLIPKRVVADLLTQAGARGLCAPLPTWFKLFANERPPDMYASQRAEFDALFSARQSAEGPALI